MLRRYSARSREFRQESLRINFQSLLEVSLSVPLVSMYTPENVTLHLVGKFLETPRSGIRDRIGLH